ncbi:MAG TPA: glycosyltransferase family 1 protein [Nitrospirae bacterium]|nr:glycosyltransferase family 1 protein [Nitrospirota bacterium]
MKIAIVRKKYTFHGGAEGFSQALVKNLAAEGHEVHIFSIKWDVQGHTENVYFHRVPAVSVNSLLRDLTFAVNTYRILKRTRAEFDIIQSHDKTLLQDIYRAGDGCHREWLRQRLRRAGLLQKILTYANPYHWLILALERRIFKEKRFKRIIAISNLVKKNIIDHYGVDDDLIDVIYNAVDLERFHPEKKKLYRNEIRQTYNIPRERIVILFVGSGFERKGLAYLIKAVESIKEPLTLMVAGKGRSEKLKKLIKKQQVIFCGPQKNIERFYASADIFAFPTIYEPFGNVHLEALASGLPVITTRLSGASEIIENGKQGFVIDEPEDIDTLRNAIELLLDKDLRADMSVRARVLAERFNFQRHIGEMFDLYSKLI